jgi:ribosome-associated protein
MAKSSIEPVTLKLAKTLKSKKAQDIIVLDMRETGQNVCDYFIICHGTSGVQTQSIAENCIRELRSEEGLKPIHVEGLNNSEWILIDYGNVVAHIFREEFRDFYKLEDLWADAKATTI